MDELDKNKLPHHIAIILDGNGRWAKKKLLPRNLGHRKGAFNIRDIANVCNQLGISYLTVFCFSTENWKRPKKEVEFIMKAPIQYLNKYRKKIYNSSIRIKIIGRRDRLPQDLLQVLQDLEENTQSHGGLTLTLCIDYGSYDEIVTAVKEIVTEVQKGQLSVDEINEDTITSHLFTKEYPPLDLLIRTSGEYRISNFLLWQLAYAELYFTDTLWPDFDEKELMKALLDYQKRNRRFGGINHEDHQN